MLNFWYLSTVTGSAGKAGCFLGYFTYRHPDSFDRSQDGKKKNFVGSLHGADLFPEVQMPSGHSNQKYTSTA